MTEKRFTIDYSDESIINTFTKQYYPTDDINGVEDICDLLNEQHEQIEQLKYALNQRTEQCDKYYQENEQLKQQLQKYDDWCNSVKRENIDKVLKMSVFEIVEAFEYYDERIEDYEKVLNGEGNDS